MRAHKGFEQLVSGLTERERMDDLPEGSYLTFPSLQRYQAFISALTQLDRAVRADEDRVGLARDALEVLPDTFSIDDFFLNQLSDAELQRASAAFRLGVEVSRRMVNPGVDTTDPVPGDPLPSCRNKLSEGDLASAAVYLNAKVGLARCLWNPWRRCAGYRSVVERFGLGPS